MTQKDKLHNDSDYIFCNKFLSYGLNKSFKQSHPEGTKIIETGCYKEPYINKILKNKKIIKNNIIYVPINLNNFFKPNFQSSQTERFKDQKKNCDILNSQSLFKPYVKILPNTCIGKSIFNFYNIEVNPICYEVNNYRNLLINSNTLITAIRKIRPKVIIFDHFSTPAYELSKTDSEIILILDKTNYPKRMFLKIIKKRFHVIHKPKEIVPIINKINRKKVEKKILIFINFSMKKKEELNFL